MEQNLTETPHLLNTWAWVEKNQKRVIQAAVVLAVAGLVIGYMVWSRNEREAVAARALSQALFTSQAEGGSPVAALMKVADEQASTRAGANALLLAANNLFTAGDYPASQAAFERMLQEHSKHPLRANAAYGVAVALAAQGKTAEATQAYQNCVNRYPNSTPSMLAQIWLDQQELAAIGGTLPEAALPLPVGDASMASNAPAGNP